MHTLLPNANVRAYPYTLPRQTDLLEVVDRLDRPLLLMPASQVLAQGLPHRKVRVILRDTQERILLVRPCATTEGLSMPLTLPGARTRAGESREAAALRVLEQSLGLKQVRIYGTGLREPAGLHPNRTLLLAATVAAEAPRAQALQVSEFLFVDRDELTGLAEHFAELLTVELCQAVRMGHLWQAMEQADKEIQEG